MHFYLTKFDFKSVGSFTCRFNFACDQHQARENVCAKQVTIVLFSGVFSQSSSLRPLQARKYCCGHIFFRNVSWAAVSPPTTKHFDATTLRRYPRHLRMLNLESAARPTLGFYTTLFPRRSNGYYLLQQTK